MSINAIIDGHVDTLSRITTSGERLEENTGHFDLIRAQGADVVLQVLALFSKERDSSLAWQEILRQIDYYEQQLEMSDNLAFPIVSLADLQQIGSGRIGLLLHLEGGEALGLELYRLRTLFRLGVRSVGLTWNNRNMLADGVMESETGGGLTRFGREVIRELNRLGMMVDLAHVAPVGFFAAIEETSSPPVVSHANIHALHPHPRNLTDRQLQALAEAKGLLGISLVPEFVGAGQVSLDDLLDHVCYAVDLMGVEHVSLGSDFDGTKTTVISDVSSYPLLIEGMARRGFSRLEIERIREGNYLRLLKEILC